MGAAVDGIHHSAAEHIVLPTTGTFESLILVFTKLSLVTYLRISSVCPFFPRIPRPLDVIF